MSDERIKVMLSDIAARIPYGVRVQYNKHDYTVVGIYKDKLLLEDTNGNSVKATVTDISVYLINPAQLIEKKDRDTLVKSVLGRNDTKGFYATSWMLAIHNDDGLSINFEPITVKDYCRWFYYNHVDMYTFVNSNRLDIPLDIKVTPTRY